MSKRVALLLGTARGPNSNGTAIANYIQSRWTRFGPSSSLDIIEPVSHFKLPALTGLQIPVASAMQYEDEAVAAWSSYVQSCAAVIIVSPQYNWSVPPSLKLALDLLFPEWKDKPVALVTYGGHGGSRLAEHFSVILPQGYKMRLLPSKVGLTLPREYIAGTKRMTDEEALEAFKVHDDQVDKLIREVSDAVAQIRAQ